jgi:hypothetical protein
MGVAIAVGFPSIAAVARRKGGRQDEWHWAAVREVIRKCPEMTHREANDFPWHIIRHVSRQTMPSFLASSTLRCFIPALVAAPYSHRAP